MPESLFHASDPDHGTRTTGSSKACRGSESPLFPLHARTRASGSVARRGIALLAATAWFSGCGYAHVNRDSATRPERSTGSAARVVMPGEPMPPMDEPITTSEPVMIGGSSSETDRSTRDRDVPFGPLAILFGYPFWIFGKSVSEEAEEAVSDREEADRARKGQEAEQVEQRKRVQQERLERENARMREALQKSKTDSRVVPSPALGASSVQEPSTLGANPNPGLASQAQSNQARSNRDLQRELAALQRSIQRRATRTPTGSATGPDSVAPGGSAPAPIPPATSPRTSNLAPQAPTGPADEAAKTEDRNRDGRPDRWVYTEADGGRRELLDENADGRADLVRRFDAENRLLSTEEDLDFDGRYEVTTQYRDGERTRRFEDTDADGRPDRWTFFANGEVRSIEEDRDGDGFRDLISSYTNGELEEQQEDRNGDGQPDRLERFRGGETTEVHEDLDGDGSLDVASYYEAGKLVRRELRSSEVLNRWSGGAPTPVRDSNTSSEPSTSEETP